MTGNPTAEEIKQLEKLLEELKAERGGAMAQPGSKTPPGINEALRTKLYESVEVLQEDLDNWLHYYNYERPHQGYRNMGRRPHDTINLFLENVQRDG